MATKMRDAVPGTDVRFYAKFQPNLFIISYALDSLKRERLETDQRLMMTLWIDVASF